MPINSNAATAPTSKTIGALLFSSSMLCSLMRSLSARASSSKGEPQNQGLRRPGPLHAILHRRNIVRCPPEFHLLFFEIGNREGGSRIAIAGLTNGTGIQQIPTLRLHADDRRITAPRRRDVDALDFGAVIGKAA